MTAKEINLIISMHVGRLNPSAYVTINGYQVYSRDLRSQAREGDEIYIESYHHYPRRFTINQFELAIAVEAQARRQAYIAKVSSRMRDSQRSKVYQWEREIVDRGTLPKVANPKRLVGEVFAAYGLEALCPAVHVSRRKVRYSSYTGGFAHRIDLAAGWGTEMEVVLHETAHALLGVGYGSYDEAGNYRPVRIEPHGPEFAALLLELYEMYLPDGFFHPERAKTKIRIATDFCLATHVRRQRQTSPLYLKRASFTQPSLD